MFSGPSVRTALPTAAMMLASGLTASNQAHSSAVGPVGRDSAELRTSAALSPAQFEERLVRRTNQRRTQVGCPPVRRHPALAEAAHRHSARMARQRNLAHQLPGEPGFAIRITRGGYRDWREVAENIAVSRPDPGVLFRLWIRSPGHRRNIDNCRLREIGIGVRYGGGRAWATQDLGRR